MMFLSLTTNVEIRSCFKTNKRSIGMKKGVFLLIVIFSITSNIFSLSIIDSLKQARIENNNTSLIESAVRKSLNKSSGIIYLNLSLDSTDKINQCVVVDSFSTYTDTSIYKSISDELLGVKLSTYCINNITVDGKRLYRVSVKLGEIKTIELYKGGRKDRDKTEINKFFTRSKDKLCSIYASSLKEESFEGSLNLKIVVNKDGSVKTVKFNNKKDLSGDKVIFQKLAKYLYESKFEQLEGPVNDLVYNVSFKFINTLKPLVNLDTIVIHVPLTEEREDSIKNCIKDVYTGRKGALIKAKGKLFVVKQIDGLNIEDISSYIHSSISKQLNSKYNYTSSKNTAIDNELLKWHRNYPERQLNLKKYKSLDNYDIMLIISFNYLTYPKHFTRMTSIDIGIKTGPVINSGSRISGGAIIPIPRNMTFEAVDGVEVIAGIKLTFYDLKTGEVLYANADYNNSSSEDNEIEIRKEVKYNIDEIVEDIGVY